MLPKPRLPLVLSLTLGTSGLAALAVTAALGAYSGQAGNPDNTFTSAPSFDSTGYQNPSAQAADTGGDNDGFELNPTYAYGDGPLSATNTDGAGDRHRYYNYGFSVPGGSTIEGVRVRLDWWIDDIAGDNSMSAELSWDGGASWTTAKTDSVESGSEHTTILGGAADTWGRSWTPTELSDANFRVRLTCDCSGDAACNGRDFYLEWVGVNVYYTPP